MGKTRKSRQPAAAGIDKKLASSSPKQVLPWETGDALTTFRLRLRDMFTEEEHEKVQAHSSKSCDVETFDCEPDIARFNLRQLVWRILDAYYFKGQRFFRVKCTKGSDCRSLLLNAAGTADEGLYKCQIHGRQSVPLLKCSLCWEGSAGTCATSEDSSKRLTMGTTPDTLDDFLVHLGSGTSGICSAGDAREANTRLVPTSAWEPATLLPAYPECGPTQPDASTGFIQQLSAVPTHHYFVKARDEQIMCDADDRVYFFEKRDEASAWAGILEFSEECLIVGVGDEKWAGFRRRARITLIKDASIAIKANLKGGRKRSVTVAVACSSGQSRAAKVMAQPPSKLDAAESAKIKGNERFRLKKFSQAVRHYEHGISVLRRMGVSEDGTAGDRWRQLLVDLYSNSAQCYLNLRDGSAAHLACAEALRYDPDHQKSLAREKVALEILGSGGKTVPTQEGCRFDLNDYFAAKEFELGICAGLAKDWSLLTKPGKLHPLFVVTILKDASEEKLEDGLLVVVRRLYNLVHAPPQASDTKQKVFLKLESYVKAYREALENNPTVYKKLFFASLVLHGALHKSLFSNDKAAVVSLKEAWEIRDMSAKHPWVEFLLARAYGGLTEKQNVEAGLRHFHSVLKKLEQYFRQRPTNKLRTVFIDSEVLCLGVHIHYETAMQHIMKFKVCNTASPSTANLMKDLCSTLRDLRDAGDALESQFKTERPEHPGIVYLPAREHLGSFLAQYDNSNVSEKVKKARRDKARRMVQDWMPFLKDDALLSDAESSDADTANEIHGGNKEEVEQKLAPLSNSTRVDDIIELSTPEKHQMSIDLSRKRYAAEKQKALAAFEGGETDVFDPVQQRLFHRTLVQHQEDALQGEKLLQAREERAREAEDQLVTTMGELKQEVCKLEQHAELVETAQRAEAKLATREKDLRAQHNQDLQALRERLEQELQAEVQKHEDMFKKEVSTLQREREQTYKLLDDELQKRKTSEEERQRLQELQMEQELAAMREEMCAAEDAADAKQREIQRKLDDQQAVHEREKQDLERKYAERWSRFKMPSTWFRDSPSGAGCGPVQIRDPSVLDALRKCLSLSREDLGAGRDYLYKPQRPHSKLHLAAAWRVENPSLMERYLAEKRQMSAHLKLEGLHAPNVRGGIWTHRSGGVAALPEASELDAELNETFLFHGTRPVTIPKIMHPGLNERVNQRGFFGAGTYLAECAGKADQYTDIDARLESKGGPLHDLHELLYVPEPKRGEGGQDKKLPVKPQHPGDVFYIFLCRAAIGFPVHSYDGKKDIGFDDFSSCGQTPAPDQRNVRQEDRKGRMTAELAPISSVESGKPCRTHYHSLIIEKADDDVYHRLWHQRRHCVWRYREFVFTHSERTYPQYLLAVQRR
eukprot:TRINITY_DN62166_c0_g1_i1.p1 TRINITY_DN62166_c0_g1~~TRINITY_DN62166_c0_g1_i1.p1  ORF type:complete len:1382 (-),score=248.74 TRINITY_DN62166_c0_g1_i1:21-4166(-)